MKEFRLQRCKENPILCPNSENPWEERAVLNPAAIYADEWTSKGY